MKASVLLALVLAGSAHGQTDGASKYGLVGSAPEEGMSAIIDYVGRRIVISGEAYDLATCGDESISVCISSKYFILAVPKEHSNEWAAEGQRFKVAGRCRVEINDVNIDVHVIESQQNNGTYDFYLNDSNALVGWKHTYKTIEGDNETYKYLLEE